jgi:hypothetical protein
MQHAPIYTPRSWKPRKVNLFPSLNKQTGQDSRVSEAKNLTISPERKRVHRSPYTSNHFLCYDRAAMGNRLLNAGILIVVGAVVVGIGWLISIGLYELGIWPLGAVVRVGVWAYALFTLYWAARHLVQGRDRIMRDQMERYFREHGEQND